MNTVTSYFHSISSRLGISREESPATTDSRRVSFYTLQTVRCPRGVAIVLALIGFDDGGYKVWMIDTPRVDLVASSSTSLGSAIVCMCALSPLVEDKIGLRNLAIVRNDTRSVVEFVDFTTNKTYHQIKTTSAVVDVDANEYVVLIVQSGGTFALHSSTSLEQVRTIQSGSCLYSLGERWLAFQSLAEPPEKRATCVTSSSSFVSTALNTVSTMSQDAFDNIVKAIGKDEVNRETILGSSPIATRKNSTLAKPGLIAVIDVVSGDQICHFEATPNEVSRPIENLAFSVCGSKILVTIGNGHYVDVYKVIRDEGRSGLNFTLDSRLNRGITPAKIHSVSMTESISAICSSNGTVHVFNGAGDSVGKVKVTDIEARLLVCETHVLVLGKSGIAELFSAGEILRDSIKMDLITREDVTDKIQLPSLLVEETPLFETCAPLPVPYWESPWLLWPGTNHRDKLTAKFVQCERMPNRNEVLEALGADLLASEREALTRDRYHEEMGREGFVQILESSK